MDENAAVVNQSQVKSDKFKILLLAIPVTLLLVVVVLVVMFASKPDTEKQEDTSTRPGQQMTTTAPTQEVATSEFVSWMFDGQNWKSSGTAPNCPNPLVFPAPVDVKAATSLLYPGQTRGGNYKAHGGFRFDNAANNSIVVSLPEDAYLYSGSRYIEAGEVQYLLDFLVPCGIIFRFDHLLTLSPELMDIIDEQLPEAKVDDSRTTFFQGEHLFSQGQTIATEVGFRNSSNVSVDFGVYDLRSRNEISSNAAWANAHSNNISQSYFALCWLENLSSADKAVVDQLEQTGSEGNVSDYCEL